MPRRISHVRPFDFVLSAYGTMRAWVVVGLLLAAPAWARQHWINPGTMGANALPSFPLERPWNERYTLLQIGAAGQVGRLDDVSLLPTFRLVTPFGKWASMIFEGAPFEAWWSSPRTRSEWILPREQGVAKADIRFGMKVLLADAGDDQPKLGFRAITKATTGKDLSSRRFIDAPAYLLDVLLGQRLGSGPIVVDVCTSVGYWIWQQLDAGQNDAVHWALLVAVRKDARLNLELELRGFIGWQTNDKPVVAGLRASYLALDFLEIGATFNAGFVDAPRFEGRLDLSFRLPLLVPLLFGASSEPSPQVN